MKKYFVLFALILITSIPGLAQTNAKPAEGKKVVVAVDKSAVAEDKFDPTRDPVADLKIAVTRAQAEGKRIILDVGGEWCSWCHFLDSFFAKNTELMKLREDNFIWLKINMSEENENTAFLGAYPAVPGYPHLFVLEKDGAFLHSQGTAILELGKSYDIGKMNEFLNKWSPAKPPPAAAPAK